MRAIWTGAISFGLVNIPVRLYSASEERELHFDLLHKKDLSPIRYARVCRADGKEIPYEDIVKGYEYQDGDYVVLMDEDFKKTNIRKTKTIDIAEFTNEEEIDSMYFDKPYYLEPAKGAEKAYAVLREALKKSKKVGLAKYVLRNRERMGALTIRGKLIVLNQMRYQSEIRKPEDLKLPDKKSVQAKEISIALALIDQLTVPFEPEKFKDEYSQELKKVIKLKSKGKIPKAKGKEPTPTKMPDLMQALRKSLEEQQRQSGYRH
jgi:DNA end-binding protein Ku